VAVVPPRTAVAAPSGDIQLSHCGVLGRRVCDWIRIYVQLAGLCGQPRPEFVRELWRRSGRVVSLLGRDISASEGCGRAKWRVRCGDGVCGFVGIERVSLPGSLAVQSCNEIVADICLGANVVVSAFTFFTMVLAILLLLRNRRRTNPAYGYPTHNDIPMQAMRASRRSASS
jgi:hypothetical protein